MNVPFYRDYAFWTAAVAFVALILGGILGDAEVELFTAAMVPVLGYLVKVGLVQKEEIKAEGQIKILTLQMDDQWNKGFQAGLMAAQDEFNAQVAAQKDAAK